MQDRVSKQVMELAWFGSLVVAATHPFTLALVYTGSNTPMYLNKLKCTTSLQPYEVKKLPKIRATAKYMDTITIPSCDFYN